MEPRKCKYNMNRKKNCQRIKGLLSIVAIYAVFSFFLKSLPVSYAWFTANTSSKGQIVNAATSDLIKMIPENISYNSNGTVKAKLSVQNISNIDIPLKVELLVNNQVLDSSSVMLYHNDTFTTGWEEIKDILVKAKDIQFRIIGFNGYISEVVTYNVDQEKVKSTFPANEAVYQVKTDEEKLNNGVSTQSTTTKEENNQGT